MPSVAFSTPDIHSGLSEAKGMLYVDENDVTLEIEVTHIGLIKGRSRTVQFELTDLDSVRHKRSILGDTLTIRTQPRDLVTDLPGAADGELCLKIKKKHRRDLDAVLDRMELWLIP